MRSQVTLPRIRSSATGEGHPSAELVDHLTQENNTHAQIQPYIHNYRACGCMCI